MPHHPFRIASTFAMVVFAAAHLTGCATPYSKEGSGPFQGGGYVQPVSSKVARIGFSGNRHTDGEVVVKYAMFRAADYAEANRKPYFVMYGGLVDTAMDRACGSPILGFMNSEPNAYSYVLLLDERRTGALETAAILEKKRATLGDDAGARRLEGAGGTR